MTRQFLRDPRRKARFREITLGIVAKDRSHRKYRLTVNTGGASPERWTVHIGTVCWGLAQQHSYLSRSNRKPAC